MVTSHLDHVVTWGEKKERKRGKEKEWKTMKKSKRNMVYVLADIRLEREKGFKPHGNIESGCYNVQRYMISANSSSSIGSSPGNKSSASTNATARICRHYHSIGSILVVQFNLLSSFLLPSLLIDHKELRFGIQDKNNSEDGESTCTKYSVGHLSGNMHRILDI